MKKFILTVLIAFVLCSSTDAQTAAKSIYVELGGPGLASINYDTRFTKKDDGIGGRIGVGYFGSEGESMLTIPVGLTYLLTKDQKNYFEIGAGATYLRYKTEYSSFNNNNDDAFTESFGHLSFGYRLQPKNGGFLFRAAVVPVFGGFGFIPYYAGVGFGYKF